jgi:hypothetical protein
VPRGFVATSPFIYVDVSRPIINSPLVQSKL